MNRIKEVLIEKDMLAELNWRNSLVKVSIWSIYTPRIEYSHLYLYHTR